MYKPSGSGLQPEECKEPNWEERYKRMNEELIIITAFRAALIDFIDVVGLHSARRDGRNYLAELLGTTKIDIMQRDKELERISKNIK